MRAGDWPVSNRTNGAVVREFEEAFAQYVGAKYAIACCNGTATLHTALVALGVKPGDRVAVPPLTMASTTLAVLHAGAVPEYVDVDPYTWLMLSGPAYYGGWDKQPWAIGVSLYGLPYRYGAAIDDAAQTLNKYPEVGPSFLSYSFQASKILSAGEGGMLVTDDDVLALDAKMFSRLGYAPSSRVDELKHSQAIRHHTVHGRAGYNYRMADCQAALLLPQLERADEILAARSYSAHCYRQAISGVDWITPQYVPNGWPHSYWTYALAADTHAHADALQEAIVQAGGERCYRAWRLTYQEPAFRHLAPDGLWRCDTCGRVRQSNKLPAALRCRHWGGDCPGTAFPSGGCPVAEDLQPRLVQLQTNHDKAGAEHAADCLYQAIQACAF